MSMANEGSVPSDDLGVTQQSTPADQQLRQAGESAAKRAVELEEALEKQQLGLIQTPTQDDESRPDFEAKHTQALIEVAKREKQNREMAAQMAEYKAQAEQLQTLQQQLKTPKERLRVLEELGAGYRELTNDVISADEDPLTPEQKEIQQLRAELQTINTTLQTQEEEKEKLIQQQEQANVQGYVKKLVDDNVDKYPFLKSMNQSARIIAEYKQIQAETGLNPDEHEVAAKVEEKLKQAVLGSVNGMAGDGLLEDHLKSLGYVKQQGAVAPQQKPAQQANPLTGQLLNPKPAPVQQTQTLTNGLSATPDEPFDHAAALARGDRVALRNNAARKASEAAARYEEKVARGEILE